MNPSRFLARWSITENPFRAEEARQDPVFQRVGLAEPGAAWSAHAEFEKIAGDPRHPSPAIVFGEKGSGKTALRLQLAEFVRRTNAASGHGRVLLVPYDDLNPFLDRFHERWTGDKKATITEQLRTLRMTDHLDAILGLVVTRLADAILGDAPQNPEIELDLGPPPEPRKQARKFDPALRADLLLAQAVYDRSARASLRSAALRRALRLELPVGLRVWGTLVYAGWAAPLAAAAFAYATDGAVWTLTSEILVIGAAFAWLVVVAYWLTHFRLGFLRLAFRLRKQIRVSSRGERSYAASLRQVRDLSTDGAVLPMTATADARLAMVERVRRVLAAFGYTSVMLVLDRVDEPALVSGDAERMQAVVWPLLNNKFLQLPGVSVKMLLPVELRHALFRESAAFFQEARLDKQSMVERLGWTGVTLYELCSARLRACVTPSGSPDGIPPAQNLQDLFADDVSRQDLIDALEHMHQPRDAFKLLYQCISDHCAALTEEAADWRIPRVVLESVKQTHIERIKQLYRGVRPA